MRHLPIFLLSAFSTGCISTRECHKYGELQHSLGRLSMAVDNLEDSIKSQLNKGKKPLKLDTTIKEDRIHTLTDPCRDLNFEQCKDKMRGIRYGGKE